MQTKPHGHGDVHMLLHSTGEAIIRCAGMGRPHSNAGSWSDACQPRLAACAICSAQRCSFCPGRLPACLPRLPCLSGPCAAAGLADRWLAAGYKWVCFFQDTNGLVFRALPAAIGKRAVWLLLDMTPCRPDCPYCPLQCACLTCLPDLPVCLTPS